MYIYIFFYLLCFIMQATLYMYVQALITVLILCDKLPVFMNLP